VLATKVHGVMADDDPNMQGNSRRHIVEQCDASLRRLHTDHIDLYQIHRPMSAIPIDETLRALDDLIRAGKVRYIGTTTYAAWQLMEALMISRELGLNRFVCEQPPYNLLDRRIERELIPFAQTYGFGVIPWSPLAGGLLTGKYDRRSPPPEGTRFFDFQHNPFLMRRWNENSLDAVDAFKHFVEGRGGATLSQFSLAWCVTQPGVTAPIIGPRTMDQLEDNLMALDVKLTEDDLKKIEEIVPKGAMVAPYYEADFGPHAFRL
jgi:aryl-alcohol dehydrogenase-like predicted oxidoreductase